MFINPYMYRPVNMWPHGVRPEVHRWTEGPADTAMCSSLNVPDLLMVRFTRQMTVDEMLAVFVYIRLQYDSRTKPFFYAHNAEVYKHMTAIVEEAARRFTHA